MQKVSSIMLFNLTNKPLKPYKTLSLKEIHWNLHISYSNCVLSIIELDSFKNLSEFISKANQLEWSNWKKTTRNNLQRVASLSYDYIDHQISIMHKKVDCIVTFYYYILGLNTIDLDEIQKIEIKYITTNYKWRKGCLLQADPQINYVDHDSGFR